MECLAFGSANFAREHRIVVLKVLTDSLFVFVVSESRSSLVVYSF